MGLALRVLAGLLVAAQVALTVLHNAPDSPARQELSPLLSATIGRFFSQDWRLFAPNPVSANLAVLATCLAPSDFAEVQARTTAKLEPGWAGPWLDITGPLIRAHQRSRLSAYDRLGRALLAAARMSSALSTDLVLWSKSCQKGDAEACAFVEAENKAAQQYARETMFRIAASFCKAVAPQAGGVGVRLRHEPMVPWSERDQPRRGEPRDEELGYFAIPTDLEASPIHAP